jgi:RNA polymerase II elongation factor ELL
MRTQKENSSHELYLRVSSASKPTVPLKNYANVTAKFVVERELDEKVTDKVRTQTIEAEKQRTERKAIMLDAPPTLGPTATTAKKRKAQPVSMFRKPPPNAASSVSGTASTSAGRSPAKDDGLRKRVIDYLACKRALVGEVVVSIVGENCSPTQRQEIIALMHEVSAHPWSLWSTLKITSQLFSGRRARRPAQEGRHHRQNDPTLAPQA